MLKPKFSMGKLDNLNMLKRKHARMLKPPRLEGVVQNRGIKNKKKEKKPKVSA